MVSIWKYRISCIEPTSSGGIFPFSLFSICSAGGIAFHLLYNQLYCLTHICQQFLASPICFSKSGKAFSACFNRSSSASTCGSAVCPFKGECVGFDGECAAGAIGALNQVGGAAAGLWWRRNPRCSYGVDIAPLHQRRK